MTAEEPMGRRFLGMVGRIDLGDASAMATLDHCCECVHRADDDKTALESKMKSLAQAPKWKRACELACWCWAVGHMAEEE